MAVVVRDSAFTLGLSFSGFGGVFTADFSVAIKRRCASFSLYCSSGFSAMPISRMVGRCIYCDSTDGLTREHVIPQGLGGRLVPDDEHEAIVLGDASCAECTKITRRLEGICLGKMMGHFRAKAGMTRKDRRTETRRVKYTDLQGVASFEDVPVKDIPAILMLPIFFEAGVFSEQPIGGPYKIAHWLAVEDTKSPAMHSDRGIGAAGHGPADYARLLAKISLGYAVAVRGIDSFTPLVRNFILGKANDEFGHWVSGLPQEPPSANLHEIALVPLKKNKTGEIYVAADIRLFAMYGAPRNYVVVGLLR